MIKPLGNLVLLEKVESGDKVTSTGLVISASFTEGPKTGKIVAIGPGEQNYKGDVIPVVGLSIGDMVYYPEHSGSDIEDTDGKKYLLLSSKNILAVKSE